MNTDVIKRMMKLKGKQLRSPTKSEKYLMEFWYPEVGDEIFNPDQPDSQYKILKIFKDYPEQALVEHKDGDKVIYLQDYYWSPSFKKLDKILQAVDVQIYDDGLLRNKVWLRKPENIEEYEMVVRSIRHYCYNDGIEMIEVVCKHFEEVDSAG